MSVPKPPKTGPKFEKSRGKLTRNEHNLQKLKARLAQYEELREDGTIGKTYIAFEVITSMMGAVLEGVTTEDLEDTWPAAYGSRTIGIPYALLMEIAIGWYKYQHSPAGDLEKSMGLKEYGQGKWSQKDKLATIDRNTVRANEVMIELLNAKETGEPISQSKAIEVVADRLGCSYYAVEKAWKNADSLKRKVAE